MNNIKKKARNMAALNLNEITKEAQQVRENGTIYKKVGKIFSSLYIYMSTWMNQKFYDRLKSLILVQVFI